MTGRIMAGLSARALEFGPLQLDELRSSTEQRPWSHWHLARDDKDIAWLLLDKSDSGTNVLSRDVIKELGDVLKQLKADKPKGLVLRSAKTDNFCAGADINEFRELHGTDEVVADLKAAHEIADRFANLSFPTLAIIHGTCLGGGLELALCCDYRLALPNATMGLPEVMLGLHPGLGGTQRLTQLIDPVEAMTLMLTGRTIPAKKAKKLGLVDDIIEERHILGAVEAAMSDKIPRQKQNYKSRLFNSDFVRSKAAAKMRSTAAEKAPPQHYPAPGALIRLWETYGGQGKRMREAEIQSFAELLGTSTAKSLVHVFFLREKMKRLGKDDTAKGVRHVHVIGAGAMGGDIAGWCALQGLEVSLFDRQREVVASAIKRTADLCRKKRLSAGETRAVMDRLIPDFANAGVSRADVVIEAVPEKEEIKQQVYAEIEPRMKDSAILATNTSSIPLERLREGLNDPGRLVGLHFFNPVSKMQLIEVVEHSAARPEALALAKGFAGRISRLPAPVSSAPGFLVNRALTPYLLEAVALLDEGAASEVVDRAAEDFGMPMGPVELADQVGLDVCVAIADMLRERLDQNLPPVPHWLRDKVARGELGRKSGRGFYHWEEGKARKESTDERPEADLADRLILPMLNACMTCLREGVVADEDLLDGAMIFGTGFAPFRGGPMHYARSRGFDDVAASLATLSERYGDRFTADPGWIQRV